MDEIGKYKDEQIPAEVVAKILASDISEPPEGAMQYYIGHRWRPYMPPPDAQTKTWQDVADHALIVILILGIFYLGVKLWTK